MRSNSIAQMDPQASAKRAGLHYLPALPPGIRRRRAGQGWLYLRPDGTRVTRASDLGRIQQLTIPPMWRRVCIASSPTAHLQAIGYDDRGRRQYLYHPAFLAIRNESKFGRLSAFGAALPGLRRQLAQILRTRELTKEKVLAAVVMLLDNTSVRIGNLEYLHANGSFGLTTLTRNHVSIHGKNVELRFKGKSGVIQEAVLQNARVVRTLRQCLKLPGRPLFQFLDEAGGRHSIHASDVNGFIRSRMGGRFTAKDFRTWNGTCTAYAALRAASPPRSKSEAKRAVVAAVKQVAAQLGNRAATSREFYIHPAICDLYLQTAPGDRFPPQSLIPRRVTHKRYGLSPDEQHVLRIVSGWGKQSGASVDRRNVARKQPGKTIA